MTPDGDVIVDDNSTLGYLDAEITQAITHHEGSTVRQYPLKELHKSLAEENKQSRK